MKHILILADGMADEPIEALQNRTPLEVAQTPNMDMLAEQGEVGLLDTIPEGMSPGSDTANLSVLGYDPKVYYTGRSPLEAISIGANMVEGDVCFRINFVTLEGDGSYEDMTIVDHSADEITTKESGQLLEAIIDAFEVNPLKFYKGVSYRHALIWGNGSTNIELTPPHNILEKCIKDFLPKGDHAGEFEDMMRKSYDILKDHPVNKARMEKGLRPANSIWPWGEGTRPELQSFEKTFGKKGAMISAVDLLKGIAIAAEMKSIDVEGATGNLHTNYEGKVQAAIDVLEEGCGFVYIHIEAPDECGHRGEMENKIKSIELIDQRVVGPLYKYFSEKNEDLKITILPDHPTPLRIRTHTNEPVPFMIYDSRLARHNTFPYTEKGAKASGNFIETGHDFMPYFLQ